MAYVTIDDFQQLRNELQQMHKDLLEMKFAMIPTVKIRAAERKELEAISKEMAAGKKHSFKEVFG